MVKSDPLLPFLYHVSFDCLLAAKRTGFGGIGCPVPDGYSAEPGCFMLKSFNNAAVPLVFLFRHELVGICGIVFELFHMDRTEIAVIRGGPGTGAKCSQNGGSGFMSVGP